MEARDSRLHVAHEEQKQDSTYRADRTEDNNLPETRDGRTTDRAISLEPMDVSVPVAKSPITPVNQGRKISEAGLYVHTDVPITPVAQTDTIRISPNEVSIPPNKVQSGSPNLAPQRPMFATRRSFEITLGAESPSSTMSSPALGALHDITPLPSPIFSGESSHAWHRVASRSHASSSASLARDEALGLLPNIHFSPPSSKSKKKTYQNLTSSPGEIYHSPKTVDSGESHTHGQNRSLSEYVPDQLQNIRPRAVSGPNAALALNLSSELVGEQQMHREEYLSRQRGLSISTQDPSKALPSPPPSNLSITDSEDGDEQRRTSSGRSDWLEIHTGKDHTVKRWRIVRPLGEGSFSHVVLAVDAVVASNGPIDEFRLPPTQLVAIKIVSHGPTAGADEERMETSIKREIDVLRSISHPSLPQMQAFEDSNARALVVLNYCKGGDLFEAASEHKDLISPSVMQRIFTELVGAVRYLHNESIVHRDIKLENVLLNAHISQIAKLSNLTKHPHPLITLTDLGLSKRLPPPPASVLLHHQCGSIDYAAPEILLGQAYDGRLTDAWALGVLLYALMEGRLPFDSLPGKRPTSVKHRIARCDWLWCAFGDRDGDWIADAGPKAQALQGAREVVEGLLKKVGRGRWTLAAVGDHPWVASGLEVPGGLKWPGSGDDRQSL